LRKASTLLLSLSGEDGKKEGREGGRGGAGTWSAVGRGTSLEEGKSGVQKGKGQVPIVMIERFAGSGEGHRREIRAGMDCPRLRRRKGNVQTGKVSLKRGKKNGVSEELRGGGEGEKGKGRRERATAIYGQC